MFNTRWLALALLFSACAHEPNLAPASISGTQWRFGGAPTARVVTFRADGTTAFTGLETSGHWKQDGNQLVFDANDFTEYRVEIEGSRMKGEWKRLQGQDKGETFPTTLERL
jgi:hypothetical protein